MSLNIGHVVIKLERLYLMRNRSDTHHIFSGTTLRMAMITDSV